MKVYIVGCGPGDPMLLTLKAKQIIEEADMLIYAGSLINKEILKFAKEGAQLFDSAKLDLEQIEALLKKAKDKNQTVGRLHSGDPAIYGAINEQIAVLNKLGIDFEVVPGVSSFLAAAASLKTELTAPGISQTIIITRMSGRTPVPDSESLKELAKHKSTMCIFLSIQKIDEVIAEIRNSYPENTPVAIVYKASRKDELIIKGTLSNIAGKVNKAQVLKTALIIVGESINNQDNVSKLYDKAFSHMYRKART
jgi:precorrin-4/cobalt-precorrin-4 C11-methyltransferase